MVGAAGTENQTFLETKRRREYIYMCVCVCVKDKNSKVQETEAIS